MPSVYELRTVTGYFFFLAAFFFAGAFFLALLVAFFFTAMSYLLHWGFRHEAHSV